MTRFRHLAYLQGLFRLALSLALIGVALTSAVLATEAKYRMSTELLGGVTVKKTSLENRVGPAFGLAVETQVAPKAIVGVNVDYLALSAGGVSNHVVGITGLIKADLGKPDKMFRWRPGAGLGLGFAGGTSWCARASIDFVWINPSKKTNWLINVGVMGWGGHRAWASPLPFIRIGVLTR